MIPHIDWSLHAGPIWLVGYCVCTLATFAWLAWRRS